MHNAAAGGHQSIVKLLVKHGADPNIKNNVHAKPFCEDEINLLTASPYTYRMVDVPCKQRWSMGITLY